MKAGTLLCWLFGHKFFKVFAVDGGRGLDMYTDRYSRQMPFCVRCGVDKPAHGAISKESRNEQ